MRKASDQEVVAMRLREQVTQNRIAKALGWSAGDRVELLTVMPRKAAAKIISKSFMVRYLAGREVGGLTIPRLSIRPNTITASMLAQMALGVWEWRERRLLLRLLRPGDVFVDAGASLGYFSAAAAACVGPEGKVYAFEPFPLFGTSLERLARKYPGVIVPVPVALGSSDGIERLCVPDPQWNIGYATLMSVSKGRAAEAFEVAVRSLDSFFASNKDGERISVIKVDVEGYEFEVLKGARRCLEMARPVILAEVSPARAYSLVDLFDMLHNLGYMGFTTGGKEIAATNIQHLTNVAFVPTSRDPRHSK